MLYSTDKSVKFLLRSIVLIIFSFTLLSCGGSSDGGGGGSPADDPGSGFTPGSGVSGVEPVTPLTQLQTSNFDQLGLQIALTGEGGSDGDIEVVVNGDTPVAVEVDPGDFESAFPKLQLKNGVTNINVKDVKRTVAADFTCEDGTSVKGVVTADFDSGVVDFTGMVNGKGLSCTSTFTSVLETTVTDMESIRNLLELWGTDNDESRPIEDTGLESTTCPQDGDSFDDIEPFIKSCSGSFLMNYVVTDINDAVHKVSTKITFSSTGSIDLPGGDLPGGDLPGGEIPDLFDLCIESGEPPETCDLLKM